MSTNRIILGADDPVMTFGPSDGGASHAKVHSIDDYAACLDEFQSHGYNEIDTARVYCSGAQEKFTAEVGWKTRGLTIATKCFPRGEYDHSREKLLKSLETSLEELQTDNVDIFYLHSPDRAIPYSETLSAINDAYKQGKFKKFGLSNYAAAEVAEICLVCQYNGWVRPTVYQGAYNVINRTPEEDLIPTLRRFGLDFTIYNPLAGGMLTGKYLSANDEKSGRFAGEGVADLYAARYWHNETFAALNAINDAGKKHDIPMTEVALRWVVHHSALKLTSGGGSDGIIIGASSLAQLKQSLGYLENGPLPEDVVEACAGAWAKMAGVRPPYYKGEYKYGYDTLKEVYGDKV